MRKGFYLLRDLGIILAAVIVMVFVGLGISRFVNYRSAREPRPAMLEGPPSLPAAYRPALAAREEASDVRLCPGVRCHVASP